MAVYFKGIKIFKRREKTPDFVIADGVIDVNEFSNFLTESEGYYSKYKDKFQLKFQILKSKDGNIYFAINDFQNENK